MNPAELIPQFDTVANLAAQVGALNDDHATAQQELAGTRFEPVVEECLAEQQQAAWQELVEKGRQLPFAELGLRALQAAREAEALRGIITIAEAEAREAVAGQLAVATKLAPSREETLSRIAEEQVEKTVRAAAADVQHELAEQEQEQAKIDELFDAAGGAWPVPQAFDYRAALEMDEPDDEVFEIIEDIIPVGLAAQQRDENIRNRVAYARDNPETTDYIHAYLTERAGETVTVNELVQFVYTPEQIDRLQNSHPRYLRSRITGLIGERHGEKLRADLSLEGFTLQYGWRIRSRRNPATGQMVQDPRERIYRAVPSESVDSYPAIEHFGQEAELVIDLWKEDEASEAEHLPETPAEPITVTGSSLVESVLHTAMPSHGFEVRLTDDEDVPPMNRAERRAAGIRGRSSITVIDQILQR